MNANKTFAKPGVELSPRPGSKHSIELALSKRHPWLLPLLDGYAELDGFLTEDIARSGRAPACLEGCACCCSQPIPVTPPEVMAIALHLNRSGYPAKSPLPPPADCVFLQNGGCSIYPVRPIACRRYIVFGKQCGPGEVPTETRPQDVLNPSRHALLYILRKTIPFYVQQGILPKNTPPGLIGMRFFAEHTGLLHEVNWQVMQKGQPGSAGSESNAA